MKWVVSHSHREILVAWRTRYQNPAGMGITMLWLVHTVAMTMIKRYPYLALRSGRAKELRLSMRAYRRRYVATELSRLSWCGRCFPDHRRMLRRRPVQWSRSIRRSRRMMMATMDSHVTVSDRRISSEMPRWLRSECAGSRGVIHPADLKREGIREGPRIDRSLR